MLEFRNALTISDQHVALLEATFGARPDHRTFAEKSLSDEHYRTLEAYDGERLVGISLVKLTEPKPTVPSLSDFAAADELLKDRPLGSFLMMAVAPSHQRRGIARDLGAAQLAWLRQQGAECLVGVSWSHGGEDCSEGLFEKGGFQVVERAPDFYRSLYAQSGELCPRCKSEDCACIALLFFKEC